MNYGIRFVSWDEADRFLEQLATEVEDRLHKVKYSTVHYSTLQYSTSRDAEGS